MAGNTHALGLATNGIISPSTIGVSSKGYLVKIGEAVYIPSILPVRTTGPGMRGFREEEKKKRKKITVTIYAYGKKHVTEHIIEQDVKVSIEDIEVIDTGECIMDVRIRNLNK